MALHVELVDPEGEVWSGTAALVIAKTLDGEIGVLTGRAPVLGILEEGSVVRILPSYGGAAPGQGADGHEPPAQAVAGDGEEIRAAVSGGFFSVADDRVSILARDAQLGAEVNQARVRAALDEAAAAGQLETAGVRYLQALLRASE